MSGKTKPSRFWKALLRIEQGAKGSGSPWDRRHRAGTCVSFMSPIRNQIACSSSQTEEDALLEDEAGIEPSETVMNIPHDLVAKVREMIAKRPLAAAPGGEAIEPYWVSPVVPD
jgi:hypothetical protein